MFLTHGRLQIRHALRPDCGRQELFQEEFVGYGLELPLDLLIHRHRRVEAHHQHVQNAALPRRQARLRLRPALLSAWHRGHCMPPPPWRQTRQNHDLV
jgi:hypothetical protein